jgi:DNA primase
MSANARGTDDWVEQVRAASDVVEVIGERVSLKRVGRNWVGLCPFHKEKTPSFSVNAERQFYHCFSCKAGGDVFRFVQELERVGFIESVEMLSRRANIAVPERRSAERNARAPLLEALDAAASAYEHWLGDPETGASARAYLERRGLSRETVKKFRLGLAPAGWENLVRRLRPRFPDEVLIDARLAGRRDAAAGKSAGVYDWFRSRLMVPLIASGGAVVGFGARALSEQDEPKYLNSPESPVYHKGSFLYALDTARRAVSADGEMIVVEGYFDAIALHQAGLANTVATSGTALSTDQARMLKRLVPRVALTYDGDRAGREAMMRSLGTLLGEGLEIAIVELPDGDDPDTLLRRGGDGAWAEARRRALDPVEFVQRHILRARPDATDASGRGGDPREAAAQAVVRLAGGIADPIRLRLFIERASQLLGLSEGVFARAISIQRTGGGVEQPLRSALGGTRAHEQSLERRLLRALLRAPAEIEAAKQRLSPEDFQDPACAALALAMWGASAAPENAGELERELLSEGGELDWAEEARGNVRLMAVRRLRQQLRERRNELEHAPRPEEAARLAGEIQQIARSLQDLST